MKTIWKGAISFGLVTIPVRVYTATEEKTVRFHQVHAKDSGRIRMKRTCSVCGEEVPFDEIAKGYEFEKDRVVVMADDEIDRGTPSTRSIDILSFVRVDEIDPIYWQKSYYLEPEPTGTKAYALLRKALGEDGLVALARFTIRDKEHLATLRLRGKTFVLETMYWPDEIREPEFDEVLKDVEIRPQEVSMARSLIESMKETFDPDAYRDEYREKLLEVISKKIAGEEIAAVASEKPSATVVDLMEALRASVEAVEAEKTSGGEEPDDAEAAGNGEGPKKSKAKAKGKKAAAG